MINHISISNFAIIENTEVDFRNGLNIVTGETGSGKSIVIEAISLALGSRADSAFVRHGADKAIIQLAGELDGEDIVITREISAAGKNLCKLNGSMVTVGQLSDLCRRLADIHDQYDNQSLLNPDNHIKLIDAYRADSIRPVKESFNEAYVKYRKAQSDLNKLLSLSEGNDRKMDFYRFEKSEIDNADLAIGEDIELAERVSLLQNSEKIFEGIETAYNLLSESDSSALASMGNSLHALQSVSQFSSEISALAEDFADAYYKLDDITTGLRSIREKITFTPEELDKAISRIDLIESLKKKYGGSIEDVLAYRDRITQELEQIENYDDAKYKLESDAKNCYEALLVQADLLTEARKLSADKLKVSVQTQLKDLNFETAQLDISFRKPENISADGNDIVELMISTNKGEPLKPLAKVASGGETSRIMLAIKSVTAACDNIPTLIFDEIDAGISGITASVVGQKLYEISRSFQIICITHLPQIAAYGDTNYKISKEADDSSTFTHIYKLSDSDKVNEIARLLGGQTVTEITRKSAEELIKEARA